MTKHEAREQWKKMDFRENKTIIGIVLFVLNAIVSMFQVNLLRSIIETEAGYALIIY
jgi:hypothetical protein